MFNNPMDHQNVESGILKMFKSLIAASDVRIIREPTNKDYKLHVIWDMSEDMDPRTSVQNVATFFHEFCEAFADRMSVGQLKDLKHNMREMQSQHLLKQSQLELQIQDLTRYKHAYELGAGRGKAE